MAQSAVRLPVESLTSLCQETIALNLTDTIARDIRQQDLLELKETVPFLPAILSEGTRLLHNARLIESV